MLTLFCDESGYTGQDLLNREQPFFSYSSVLIEPEEAASLVQEARTKANVGTELKGSRLLSSKPGRNVAEFIFSKLVDRSITVVANKRFSLAGKLYEYIFDPVVEGYQGLYEIGFHQTVANHLYEEFTNRKPDAVELLRAFQRGVRNGDYAELTEKLASSGSTSEIATLSQRLGRFCIEQQELIKDEFVDSGNDVVDKWGLDLSSTCITGLLRVWADRDAELHLVLDDSKPLTAWAEAIAEFVPIKAGGQEPGRYFELAGKQTRINFALAEPIRFASSRDTPGLQLADVMAAFVADLMTKRNQGQNAPFLKEAWEKRAIDSFSIFPSPTFTDRRVTNSRRNLMLLDEIFRASGEGLPIRESLPRLAQKVYLIDKA